MQLLSSQVSASMTTTILTLFDCIDIDPLNEIEDPRSLIFLRVDMSINCSKNQKYFESRLFSIFMMCIFPISSLCLIFSYLYINKELLLYRDQIDYFIQRAYLIERKTNNKVVPNERSKELKIKEQPTSNEEQWESLKPLVEPYKKEYWFWEIVEIFKRLMLSAGISIMFPGTPLQIVIGVLMAIIFYRFDRTIEPSLIYPRRMKT